MSRRGRAAAVAALVLLLVAAAVLAPGCSRYVMEDEGMEHNKQVFLETFAECGITDEQAEEGAFVLRTVRIGTIVEIESKVDTIDVNFFEVYFTDDAGIEYYMSYSDKCYISAVRRKDAFQMDFMYTIEQGLDYYAWLADRKAGIPGTPEEYPRNNYLGFVPRSSTVDVL
jgi:hypothetical protein